MEKAKSLTYEEARSKEIQLWETIVTVHPESYPSNDELIDVMGYLPEHKWPLCEFFKSDCPYCPLAYCGSVGEPFNAWADHPCKETATKVLELLKATPEHLPTSSPRHGASIHSNSSSYATIANITDEN